MKPVYPLAAIVGQDTFKQALLLAAVNPGVGGLLVRGEKGTAKSTMVRALAGLLPPMEVVEGCVNNCSPEADEARCPECSRRYPQLQTTTRAVPLVDLPLNATEDRVSGGIDFPRTLREGRVMVSPGLLARAHRGLLYIDEVNLLDDHIVDLILDAAASGENRIEREGISYRHPSRCILVGTMNPEEGELRPQLLDRFGLCLEVAGSDDPESRVELMVRREDFDQDPCRFAAQFQAEGERLAEQIIQGRKRLPRVRISKALRGFIGELCREKNVAGHRADLVMEQAARALAALAGKNEVSVEHITQVAPLVLLHRMRDAEPPPPPPPPEPPQAEDENDSEQEEQEEHQEEQQQPEENPESMEAPPPQQSGEEEQAQESPQPEEQSQEEKGDEGTSPTGRDEQVFEIGTTFRVKSLTAAKDRVVRRGSGRRSRSRISQKQGRYVKSTLQDTGDFALDATLRAAAPYQQQRKRAGDQQLAVQLRPQDIRSKVREKRIGNFLLFVVDASGSMGARGRMAASKGAVMSLLLDAYQKRDKVSMITFRRNEATVNLPPTTSVDMAGRLLSEMPVGGRTPLSAGLAKSHEQVRNYLIKNPTAQPIVLFITDGKCNVALGERKPVEESLHLAQALSRDQRIRSIVVDTEEAGLVTFGLAQRLAGAMEAQYFKIDDLKAEALVNIVRGQQQ
ncbi:putative cobaltochelatase [Desulfobulbus rhabdoformis]|uniref:putative cobaltochelatase n=1 Tax=Desulfobulbus rhabdoformis TaxID=34032 RepID=UPI0019656323|nr:putative cobaltochelatase [Desulfobulbus rhabdoformis]MBM9616143.1 putative cobaltochelatase [Desulfobulbus rhabdoformis]